MTDEILEELKKYIPETSDFDVGVVEQFYKVAEEKHSSEKEKLLKIYLFGYLLTSLDDFDFTKVQVSNITIEESLRSGLCLILKTKKKEKFYLSN